AGIFILPFFLFSATAGQMADKFEKSRLIRWIKAMEIIVMGLGAISLMVANVYMMIFILFLMGAQSAFFGPVKYSILPNLLPAEELIGANALVEAGTFLAILLGTIAGGLFILGNNGTLIISVTLLTLSCLGLASSFAIPATKASDPALKLNINLPGETWSILRQAGERRDILLSIMGISWFWLLGATFLSQFPAFAKDVVGADQTVVTLFLTLFSVGIALGSLLCNKILKGAVSAKYVPFGALGMSLFIADLYLGSDGRIANATGVLVNFGVFLSDLSNWRIVLDLVGTAVCGGIFIVPLYAILQTRGDDTRRSRTIAANNILNALFMVIGAVIATMMLAAGFSVPQVFLSLAAGNIVIAIYVCGLLPDAVVKAVLKSILKLCYRVEIKGLDNYAKAGKRAVIVVNHVSFLDAVLLAVYLPIKPMFAINTHIARAWWMKPFLALVDAFPMDPTNPMATKALIKAVREDRHCVIFPEGRITVTGSLMKVYEGPGMIAEKSDAMLVPVRVDGAQYTPFSRLRGKIRLRWFPKITLTILEPRRFLIADHVTGREHRRLAALKLYDVMCEM
ncbi:MAG: acyl-[ACP]--phospholipid O-acyltransferase, partial [Nitrospinae bacterium CG11_big_fil_rev_8_21_14_0_20_56_8]